MKRGLWLLLFLLFSTLALADNMYLYDSLQTTLTIDGDFQLVPQNPAGRVSEASVDLSLVPVQDYRQQRLSLDSSGSETQDKMMYSWNNPASGGYGFGYTAVVKTVNKQQEVRVKVPFPVQNVAGFEEYLLPTESIDSDHSKVRAKAAELAEGEDDLFVVSFKIASWVEQNVDYDLNTLTAESSQKASWVLEHREGVCDEMTSLFVAMMRSLGVPARFVSGISYTTSDLFDDNWQPHGWAEVYFPEIGWVSFDITFGEYGYVDVTHIKLRDGFDPTDPATEYQWTGQDVDLKPGKLKTRVEVLRTGSIVPEDIRLDLEVYASEIGLQSYNLVKGVLRNTADHYAATTLQLAAPPEIRIEGRNKRTLLLASQETKETYWVINLKDSLDPQFQYTFPLIMYTEQNTTAEGIFTSREGAPEFTQQEIEDLTIKDEEKTYSRKVSFHCTFPPEIKVGETAQAECALKNEGNANLRQVRYCLGDHCENVDLLINQRYNLSTSFASDAPGWKRILLTAENDLIEKKSSIDYAVLDEPQLDVDVRAPERAEYGTDFTVRAMVNQSSFSSPKQVTITVKGNGFQNTWALEELTSPQELILNIDGKRISFTNEYAITSRWQDSQGETFSETKSIRIEGEGKTVSDKWRMFLNMIAGWFY